MVLVRVVPVRRHLHLGTGGDTGRVVHGSDSQTLCQTFVVLNESTEIRCSVVLNRSSRPGDVTQRTRLGLGMGTSRQANGIFHGAQTNGTRNSPTDLLQFIPDDHSNVVLVLVVLVRVVVGRIMSFGVTIGRRGVRGDGRHG
jgi:hypothetical protein